MAGEAPLILGVSGLRGIVGETFTPEVAVRYAEAVAWWLRKTRLLEDDGSLASGGPTDLSVVVARDGRAGGEVFYHAVISALLGSGCDVLPIGVAMTPTVACTVDLFGANAAVIVTASHNPSEWNGLKVVAEGALSDEADDEVGDQDDVVELGCCAPPAEQAELLVQAFQEARSARVAPQFAGRMVPYRVDAVESHADLILQMVSGMDDGAPFDLLKNRRIVTDSVNASGGRACRVLAGKVGLDLVQLGGDDSGLFQHTPEPTAANLSGDGGLCDTVVGAKAAVGFAQDPDADRLAIVDERGRYIGEEYTLVLAAWRLLLDEQDHPSGTPVICVNLSTSRMIDDLASKFGAEVVRTAVGEANVVQAMKRAIGTGRNVLMGGEGNGGVIWHPACVVRDSLGSMALVLSLMARTGKTVSELVAEIDAMASGGKGGGYAIVKRKVDIPSKDAAAPAVEAVAEAYADQTIDRQDGVRVDWDDAPHGGGAAWLHVRASNTEPIMRLIAEAGSAAQAEAILDAAAGVIGG
ncbi:MAG: hypothetical protein AAF297_01240 [Planctomycetota bacterium]